jgi:hypothetical protein
VIAVFSAQPDAWASVMLEIKRMAIDEYSSVEILATLQTMINEIEKKG